ncbi:hypothetical protein GCM10020000_87710 [Streptomyces olivoverticillatus]
MRVDVVIDLNGKNDKTEHTAEFSWETDELPLPRRGDRIAFGELITVVDEVMYKVTEHQFPDVELRLRLSKQARKGAYTLAEICSILSPLVGVIDPYVTRD